MRIKVILAISIIALVQSAYAIHPLKCPSVKAIQAEGITGVRLDHHVGKYQAWHSGSHYDTSDMWGLLIDDIYTTDAILAKQIAENALKNNLEFQRGPIKLDATYWLCEYHTQSPVSDIYVITPPTDKR